MKKITILLIATLFAFNLSAQVLQKGDNVVNFGLGIPSYGAIRFPAIMASWEMGFTEKIGIGYIGGGIYLGISGTKAGFNNYTQFTFGPRAAYHFDFAEITGSNAWDKLDIYAGVMVGFRIESNHDTFFDTKSSSFKFSPDFFIGGRYNFSEKFGVYAEVGAGVSYLNGGVCMRF